jgi:hypothetical protein
MNVHDNEIRPFAVDRLFSKTALSFAEIFPKQDRGGAIHTLNYPAFEMTKADKRVH